MLPFVLSWGARWAKGRRKSVWCKNGSENRKRAMPTFPFMQVDAFTDRPLGGNPCAIVFDADTLDAATMLAIAREMNLSETSFVVRSSVADVGARYFTPAEEIPMAGHPTIATIFALAETGRLALTGAQT